MGVEESQVGMVDTNRKTEVIMLILIITSLIRNLFKVLHEFLSRSHMRKGYHSPKRKNEKNKKVVHQESFTIGYLLILLNMVGKTIKEMAIHASLPATIYSDVDCPILVMFKSVFYYLFVIHNLFY